MPLNSLCRLHGESSSVVSGWIDNSYNGEPDFTAIYELYLLLNKLDLAMPIEISKLMDCSQNRAINVAIDMTENPMPGEENKRVRTQRSIYYYKNKAIYLGDIKEKLNLDISNSTVLSKIRKAGKSVGDSIDDVDFTNPNWLSRAIIRITKIIKPETHQK